MWNSKINEFFNNEKVRQSVFVCFWMLFIIIFSVTTSITYAAYVQSIKNSYKYMSVSQLISKEFSGGDGTKDKPFAIKNAKQLKALSNLNTLSIFDNKTYFELASDIEWKEDDGFMFPIGNNDYPFDSQFDGKGHVVSYPLIYGNNTIDVGFFGYCGANSTIKNTIFEYPRVVVDSNSFYVDKSNRDSLNSNPLDELFINDARKLPTFVNKEMSDSGLGITWKKEQLKKNYCECSFRLPKYIDCKKLNRRVPINWELSSTKVGNLIVDKDTCMFKTIPNYNDQNPDNTLRTVMLSGYVSSLIGDTYQRYNLERYQINVRGTGEINENIKVITKNNEKIKVPLGVVKSVHNSLLNDNFPISVGLIIGRTDGKANHLGMIGGRNTNDINDGKGIIQIAGRGAYTSSVLIGRERITGQLDNMEGGKELQICFDMSSKDPDSVDYKARHKVASCWPNPFHVPTKVDVNNKTYSNLQEYREQQSRGRDLTDIYYKLKEQRNYKDTDLNHHPNSSNWHFYKLPGYREKDKDGFWGAPDSDFTNRTRLRGDTKDYHYYNFEEKKWRDGKIYNAKIFPECELVNLDNVDEYQDGIGIGSNKVKGKNAVKINGGLGASTYSWYTSIPDNYNDRYQKNWGWGYNQFNYRSWQLYGHAPDCVTHNDTFSAYDPEYGYYWTHVIRNFAVNNGVWLWASKDDTPIVDEGNLYDVKIKLKYVATNRRNPGHFSNNYNWKILYNHYNPDIWSYEVRGTLSPYWYYFHSSYMQNLVWYELNNPYTDEHAGTWISSHSSNGKIVPDNINAGLYDPKNHPIIDDGQVHTEIIKFAYDKVNNRAWRELKYLGDDCEWFPCFAVGMGKIDEEGVNYWDGDKNKFLYNYNGPEMGGWYKRLGNLKTHIKDSYDVNNYNKDVDTIDIWDNKYYFYNGARFQTWDRIGNGLDGFGKAFEDKADNAEENSTYNDRGFFGTQYQTDNDIDLYLLKVEADFTSRSGNKGDLIEQVDFLTDRNTVIYDEDDGKYISWQENSEVKPSFDVDNVKKDEVITYAFGRDYKGGFSDRVYGFYSNEKYKPISTSEPEIYEEYWKSNPNEFDRY